MLISEFADKIGVTRADVENWVHRHRQSLTTEYAPTVAGKARHYSRENVLELAFLAALNRSGWPPREALRMVEAMLIVLDQPNWGPYAWFAFPVENFTRQDFAPDLGSLDLEEMAARSPLRSVSLIHVGKIVETVNALFAEKGEA